MGQATSVTRTTPDPASSADVGPSGKRTAGRSTDGGKSRGPPRTRPVPLVRAGKRWLGSDPNKSPGSPALTWYVT